MKFIKSQTNKFQARASYYPTSVFVEFSVTPQAYGMGIERWTVRGNRANDLYDVTLATFDTIEEAEASLKDLIAKLGDEKHGATVLYAWPQHYKGKEEKEQERGNAGGWSESQAQDRG